MKNDKTKLIIWATVALVIGVIIGAFLIGPMTTTGEAKAIAKNLTVNAYTDEEVVLDAAYMFGESKSDQITGGAKMYKVSEKAFSDCLYSIDEKGCGLFLEELEKYNGEIEIKDIITKRCMCSCDGLAQAGGACNCHVSSCTCTWGGFNYSGTCSRRTVIKLCGVTIIW